MLPGKRRVVALLTVTALLLGASAWLATPAGADLPPGAGCPATPGTGPDWYKVTATLPGDAGQNANGVCINCTGTGGSNNSAVLVTNAAGCGATLPTVGAGGSYVWADWGTTSCVAPGNTVTIRFRSSGSLSISSVTWNLANGTPLAGTGTVVKMAVGGIAEGPGLTGTSAGELGASDGGSGWSAGAYAALAAGLAAVVVALSAGAWYARRRFSRS
jgi:hypothetical protein